VAAPNPTNAARTDLDALEGQLLGDADGTMSGVIQAVIENGFLDLFADSVRVRSLGAWQFVQKALGAKDLVVTADLVELLAGVTHHLAGLADVLKILRQF